jgi:hypothetical protein
VAGGSERSCYRSAHAEFDKRAVQGMVHSPDVELGATGAHERRVTGVRQPPQGCPQSARWCFFVSLFA